MIGIHLKKIRELNIIYTGERGNKSRISRTNCIELDATGAGKSLNRRSSHVCVMCLPMVWNSAHLGAAAVCVPAESEEERGRNAFYVWDDLQRLQHRTHIPTSRTAIVQ